MGKEQGDYYNVTQTDILLQLYKNERAGCDGDPEGDVPQLLANQVCNHLVSAQHTHKFRLKETLDMLENSITSNPHWDLSSGRKAFRALEKYALNLVIQPWRLEFHKIKLYSGFVQSRIKPYLNGFECFLERLGYTRVNPCVFELTRHLATEDLYSCAFDCFLAQVECGLMKQMLKRVVKYKYTIEHVYKCRTEIQGEETKCITWIKEHCMPVDEVRNGTHTHQEHGSPAKVPPAAGSVGGAKPKQINSLNKVTLSSGSNSPSRSRKVPTKELSDDSGYNNGKGRDLYNNSQSSSSHSSHTTTPVTRSEVAGPPESISAEQLYGHPDIYDASAHDDHYQNSVSYHRKIGAADNLKDKKHLLSTFSSPDTQRNNSKSSEKDLYQRLRDSTSGPGNIYNEIDEVRRPDIPPTIRDLRFARDTQHAMGVHKLLEKNQENMLSPKKPDSAKSYQNVNVEVHREFDKSLPRQTLAQKSQVFGSSSHVGGTARKPLPNQDIQQLVGRTEKADSAYSGSSSSEGEHDDVLTRLTADGETGTIKINRNARKLDSESTGSVGTNNGISAPKKKPPPPPPPVKPKVLRARSVETSGSPPMMMSIRREGSASAGQSPVISRKDKLIQQQERHKGSAPVLSGNNNNNKRFFSKSATLDPSIEVRNPGTISAARQSEFWQCHACTTFNHKDIAKCEICCSGQMDTETTPGGIACPVCTLINDKNQTQCVLCLNDLKRTSA